MTVTSIVIRSSFSYGETACSRYLLKTILNWYGNMLVWKIKRLVNKCILHSINNSLIEELVQWQFMRIYATNEHMKMLLLMEDVLNLIESSGLQFETFWKRQPPVVIAAFSWFWVKLWKVVPIQSEVTIRIKRTSVNTH